MEDDFCVEYEKNKSKKLANMVFTLLLIASSLLAGMLYGFYLGESTTDKPEHKHVAGCEGCK